MGPELFFVGGGGHDGVMRAELTVTSMGRTFLLACFAIAAQHCPVRIRH